MISSTSRLLLPIDQVLIPLEGEKWSDNDPVYHFSRENKVLKDLVALVDENMKDMSESIF